LFKRRYGVVLYGFIEGLIDLIRPYVW